MIHHVLNLLSVVLQLDLRLRCPIEPSTQVVEIEDMLVEVGEEPLEIVTLGLLVNNVLQVVEARQLNVAVELLLYVSNVLVRRLLLHALIHRAHLDPQLLQLLCLALCLVGELVHFDLSVLQAREKHLLANLPA